MPINKVSRKRLQVAGRALRWPWSAVLIAVCVTAACTSAGTTAAIDAAGPATATLPAVAAAGPVSCAPPGVKSSPCYTPRAYQVAYGVAPLLSHGIDGRGETVVIPDPVGVAPAMDIRKDLAAFDREFGLPAAKLHIVNTLAKSATPYLDSPEEVTDTEMVHAIAPGATIDVVLVPQTTRAGVAAALAEVIEEGITLHAAVVSISVSRGEHVLTSAAVAGLNAALEQARARHVTVVASSGDTGAIADDGPPRQVSLPASDPLVLAVGGTALSAARGGAYQGEMAWNDGSDASGGGYSILFPQPSYQDGLTRAGTTRGVPDVAANADSDTAMAETYSDGESRPASGTSAATPLWAALIALADQAAGRPLGFVNPAIYQIARGPAYDQAFHDVVTGDNSVLWPTGLYLGYTAAQGWDAVTGWGSPDAQYLVPLLARTARTRG
jgi:subtilase family serine protease